MIELIGNHLWQSTLFAAAAGLITLTLRSNRAHVRYWLWLAASVKFLVPFSLFVVVGSQFHLSSPIAVPPAIVGAIQPAASVVARAVGRPYSTPLPDPTDAVLSSTADRVDDLPALLLGLAGLGVIWIAGCGMLAVDWLIGWRRVAAVVRRGSPITAGDELRALRRLESVARIKRPTRLVLCDAVADPGVFGILRPVLLWPRRMGARLVGPQLDAILVHEICHIRRRDNLAAAAHAVVHALFWFHPLVWWIGAHLVAERERACDEEVVRLGSDPRVYAESILRACRLSVELAPLCVAGVASSDLGTRIERILSNDAPARVGPWKRLLLGSAGLAALLIPIAMGMATAPPLRAQTPAVQHARHGFGPPDINRILGFELLPGPPRKPSDDPPGAVAWTVVIDQPSGRRTFSGFTARGLIRYSFGRPDVPVVGGPSWIDSQSMELSGTTSAEEDDDELRALVKKLLEERFKLTTHREFREFPVYALHTVREGVVGPTLLSSTSSCSDHVTGAAIREPSLVRVPEVPCGVDNGLTGLTFRRVTMEQLAAGLLRSGPMLDRKVVDRTGISGVYDGTLDLGFLPASAVLTRRPATGILLEPLGVRSMFRAIPEQLGLRLDDATERGEVVVIDNMER